MKKIDEDKSKRAASAKKILVSPDQASIEKKVNQ